MPGYLPEAPLENMPRYWMHRTRGKVRLEAYHPKHMTGKPHDLMTVIDKNDARVTVPRHELRPWREVKKDDSTRLRREAGEKRKLAYTSAASGVLGLSALGALIARKPRLAGALVTGHAAVSGADRLNYANTQLKQSHRLDQRAGKRVKKADEPTMNRGARRAEAQNRLRDPRKAYEAARAKGYPHDYDTFLGKQTQPDAKRAAQAAAKEARQHTIDAGTIRRLPWHAHINRNQALNAAGSLALAGTAAGIVHHRRQQMAKRGKTNAALGAASGAAAADAAYVVGGQAAKARIKTVQQRRGFTPEEQRVWAEHKQKAGLKPGEKITGKTPASVKHKIFAHYDRRLPAWKAQRILGWKNNRAVNAAVVGSAALSGGMYASRSKVGKRLSFSQVGMLTGSGTAGALIGSTGTKREDEGHEAVGALAGGWAGQGAYQMAGYGPRKLVRGVRDSRVPLHERDVPKSRMQTPEQRKAYDRFRRQRRALKREYPSKVDQKRHTPREWHGARTERVLAHTHGGRLGTAIGSGMTALGVGAGVRAAQRYDRNHHVGKSATYGYQTKDRSWPKTTEMLGGLGLLGYGVPRVKALGPASEKGVKFAEKHGAGEEARAVQELARALGQRMNETTERGEAQLRRIKAVDNALRLVPKSMRGEVATAAGVLVAAHAHPTTKNRFTPIGRQ